MKRYAVFLARFGLVPIISGTFVVSSNGHASLIEWAHVVAGFGALYLILGLLLLSAKHREVRLPALVALLLGLLEAIPGTPRLHAAVSPLVFAALTWAAVAMPAFPPAFPKVASGKNLRIFLLPALVLPPIVYGVGYRHQTSGVVAHIGAAMLAAGVLLIFCVNLNQKESVKGALRGVSNMTIAAVLFQIAAGVTLLVIRMLDIDGGLALGLARTAHITGAAPLLAAAVLLAIQYRRTAAQTAAQTALGARLIKASAGAA